MNTVARVRRRPAGKAPDWLRPEAGVSPVEDRSRFGNAVQAGCIRARSRWLMNHPGSRAVRRQPTRRRIVATARLLPLHERRVSPQELEVVKPAALLEEEMHDDVQQVNQDPLPFTVSLKPLAGNVPSSGVISPANVFTNVVLPMPLGPMIPMTSFWCSVPSEAVSVKSPCLMVNPGQ